MNHSHYDDPFAPVIPALTAGERAAFADVAKIRRLTVLLEDCVSLMARSWWPPAGEAKRKKAALMAAVTQELTRP